MSLPRSTKQHSGSRRIHLFNFGCIEYQPGVNKVSGTFELTAFPGKPVPAESASPMQARETQSGSGSNRE